MRLVSDDTLAIMNAWMEARGESFEGVIAVCEVMRNRTTRKMHSDGTLTSTILAPFQFSGFNTKDPNRTLAFQLDDEDPAVQRIARAWEWSKTSNMTKGATLYYNPRLVSPAPAWARSELKVATIGNHEFYKGV